jgi:hypothetical protein
LSCCATCTAARRLRSRALGRDYKRVYEDVDILSTAGLLDRTGEGGVRAAYDEIGTVISLEAAE